jgi:hypothetical protein
MATVTRDGRTHVYRSVQRNGRVTSEFCGSGKLASLIALMDALDRKSDAVEREELAADRQQSDAIEQAVASRRSTGYDRGRRPSFVRDRFV